jgi:hypothetical protein
MKTKRDRTSPWLVQDIYLRDTWGKTYYVSRRRRFDARRFFVAAMVLFGLVDVFLASIFALAYLYPTRTTPVVAVRRPAATRIATAAARVPTKVAQVPTPTRAPPTARAASPTPPPTQVPPTAFVALVQPTAVPPTAAAQPTRVALAGPPRNLAPARTVAVSLPETLNIDGLAINIPPEPVDCTPANAMGAVVTFSINCALVKRTRPFCCAGMGSASLDLRVRSFARAAAGSGLLSKGRGPLSRT